MSNNEIIRHKIVIFSVLPFIRYFTNFYTPFHLLRYLETKLWVNHGHNLESTKLKKRMLLDFLYKSVFLSYINNS